MPSSLNPPVYPFDPTGTLLSNKVVNEEHILTVTNYRDFQFVVPTFAPFFEAGLQLTLREISGNVRPLVYGVDYYLSHKFHDASLACAEPIYGSVTFLNNQLTGVVKFVQYQTIGGLWNINEAAIAEIMADRLANPRTTTWEQVVELPLEFPVIDHEWDLVDMVGMSEVVAALAGIEDAIRDNLAVGLPAHANRVDNPHAVSKVQVGLGNVRNYDVADLATVIAGISTTTYVTPAGVHAAIVEAVTAHLNELDPHPVYLTEERARLLFQPL